MTKVLARQLRRVAQCSSVYISCNSVHIIGILVASRGCHLQQRSKLAGHHKMTRRSRGKDKSPTTLCVLVRELLGERPSPGKTQHIYLFVTQLVEQPRAQQCE